ncbi:MAG: SDR family oxidoreductase [Rhodobacter sp.]|jgi:NAD(P)-dependent dehydrogenase (short-subunit alcohol dehydrogenase family)|nr:SDR family oxidoreductase [Rhodobacter sp.]
MTRMAHKVCVVTGGAVGLGRVYCQALAKEGARVAVLDIVDGSDLAHELGGIYVKTDVSDAANVDASVARVREHFGRIDVLVNNAAIFSTLPLARYDQIDPDLWDQVMAVNTKGAFLMIRAVGPVMEAQGSGKIINITSGTTYKGMPNLLHYVSSKGALVAMTRCLSRELGDHGICINNLSPGLILSDSISANKEHVDGLSERVIASRALKRHGYPDDLIGALLFLASADSDFVTGQTIAVDGGSVNT